MNQDRYPDLCMPMGINERPPRGDASWGVNPMGINERPPRGDASWGVNPMMGKMPVDCVDHETEILDVKLAHAYVPYQEFCPTFSPMTSLKKGTAFPGLKGVYGWERRRELVGGEYV